MIWYLTTLFENILWIATNFWPIWAIAAFIFALAVPVYVESKTGSSWKGTKAFLWVICAYFLIFILTSPFWHP